MPQKRFSAFVCILSLIEAQNRYLSYPTLEVETFQEYVQLLVQLIRRLMLIVGSPMSYFPVQDDGLLPGSHSHTKVVYMLVIKNVVKRVDFWHCGVVDVFRKQGAFQAKFRRLGSLFSQNMFHLDFMGHIWNSFPWDSFSFY